MKAIILAAGKGERLKDITKDIPKPMIEFKGKPVLQYNIELCKRYGIKEIYINLYHLPEKITEYFGDGKKFGVNIKYSYEEELLGTAGAVKKIAKDFWYTGKDNLVNKANENKINPFFVIYGDQISDFELNLLGEEYNKRCKNADDCLGVIAFHHRADVQHSGVAELDENNRIKKFIEKPKEGETTSHWVNAGVYLLNPLVIDRIAEGFSDFGKQIFPSLLSSNYSLYGVCKRKSVSVFDTPEMYSKTMNLTRETNE